jgi:hypothetical protein
LKRIAFVWSGGTDGVSHGIAGLRRIIQELSTPPHYPREIGGSFSRRTNSTQLTDSYTCQRRHPRRTERRHFPFGVVAKWRFHLSPVSSLAWVTRCRRLMRLW